MKMLLSLSLLLMASYATGNPDETYSTAYDNIDVDVVLRNDRLYRKYLDCFTGTGKCTSGAEQIKKALPDAIKTKCSKCSKAQKVGIEKVLKYTLDHQPEDYATLEKAWDPDRYYRKLWEGEAKA